MTDSYFASLGRAADAPPDISKTNYLQDTPDMSKAVNENIDEISKSWDAHYNQMIEIWKHIHKQKSPAENLLEVMKHGKDTKDEYEQWQKWYKPFSEMSKKIKERQAIIRQNIGEDAGEYKKAIRNILDDDDDVKKENEVEGEKAAARVKTQTWAYNNLKLDPSLFNLLSNGEYNQHDDEVNFYKDIKELKNGINGWNQISDEAIKHHLPQFGYTEDGEPIHKSVNEAIDPEDKEELRLRNIAFYTYLHQDVARGRFGRYKKDFILDIIAKQDEWKKGIIEDYTAASLETITGRNDTELFSKVEEDPNEFITQILTHTNHPEFINSDGNVNHKLVLDRYFEKVADGILNGKFENPVEFVKALGNVEFQAFGHQQGKLVKIKDHWKKRYRTLIAAVKQYQEAEKKAKEADTEIKQNSDQQEITKFCESSTFSECKARVAAYDTTWGTSDENRPTVLNNLLYNIREPEKDQIERLENIKITRPLTRKDLVGLTPGTPAHDKYLAEIETPLSVGAVKKGPGSYEWRDRFIKDQIAFNLKIKVSDVQGNPKGKVMLEKAEMLYNQVYYDTKDVPGQTVSNLDAHNEAVAQVKDLLDLTKNPTVGDSRLSTGSIDASKVALKAARAIQKNPDLINSSELLEGEEPQIHLAAKYIDDIQNNRGGTAPNYYKNIGAVLGNRLSVPQIIRARLEALGMLKEGQVIFPEEGKPGERLLVNPTAAKTIRVYNLNEDYEWMLESSKSPTAIANGGYLSVSDSDGNYTNIEETVGKTFENITMGDVVGLIANGYTGFGVYDIPSYDLIDIINSNGIPMDMIFDEDGQDFLYLAALRNKAQKAQRNTGIVTDYRRLVNIDKDLHDKFNKLAGDLVKGKPWLDLNNLAPEVAKEWIRQLTQ